MKNKAPLILFLGLVVINLLSNSCKKDNNSNIPHLLTNGVWQLASIQVYHYVGSSQIGDADTLNATCQNTQFFTFKTDNTCTYTNFDCLPQTSTGNWMLTSNKVYFTSDMVCKDTVTANGGSSRPFSNTQIQTLGTYSLVLQTGDVQPNYSSTKPRTVVRYGFIRQKATTNTP
jgi:hypothetical protein